MNAGVAPVEGAVIRDIDQTHRAAWVRLPSGPHGPRSPVRKGQFLAMTSGAGAGAVDRHSLVVKQGSAQADFRLRHGIIGRHMRLRKSPGQDQCIRRRRFSIDGGGGYYKRRQCGDRYPGLWGGAHHIAPQLIRTTFDNTPSTVIIMSVSPMPLSCGGSLTVTWSRP